MADKTIDTIIRTPITETLDPSLISPILSSAPFINIDSLFNLRDISDGTNAALRKGFVLRSGSLENISEAGKAGLVDLGIRTIFDLRSEREIKAFPDPQIDGVEVVEAKTDTDPVQGAQYATGDKMYMSLLATHKDIWRKVFEHVRDQPEKPILLHCTGGKDRTGVAAALILGAARADTQYISREYALTRLGIEPAREMLTLKLTGGKPIDLKDQPKLAELMRMDPEVMEDFLREVKDTFGGIDKYIARELGFSEADLAVIRDHLRQS